MANSFVRNSMVNAVAGVFTTLGGFLGTILVARLLGVSGTGVVAFATWAVTVAVILSDLGLTGCLPRFLPELLANGDVAAAERLCYSLYRSFLVSITSIALCFALYAIWLALSDPLSLKFIVSSNGYATSPVFWVLVGCAGFVQGLGNFCTGWIKGLQDFGMLARVALAGCLAQTLATAMGATFFGVTGALASLAFGALMPALLLFRLPRRRGPISAPLRGTRNALLARDMGWLRAQRILRVSDGGVLPGAQLGQPRRWPVHREPDDVELGHPGAGAPVGSASAPPLRPSRAERGRRGSPVFTRRASASWDSSSFPPVWAPQQSLRLSCR